MSRANKTIHTPWFSKATWLNIEADLLTKSKVNLSHDSKPLFYLPHEQQWMLILNINNLLNAQK